jgi:hypothetical protein
MRIEEHPSFALATTETILVPGGIANGRKAIALSPIKLKNPEHDRPSPQST